MDRIFVNSFKLLAVRWLVLASTMKMVFSRPMEDSRYSHIIESTPIFDDAYRYLMEFGYLPKVSNSEISNLLAEDQIIDALQRLQKMGNIPVTGRMDAATKQLMRNRRCGVSDDKIGGNHRSKRYSLLQGLKWDHLQITWSLRTKHLDSMKRTFVRRDLIRAFEIWSKHSNLKFREVDSNAADILVLFAKGSHDDGNPFDGPGRILAHAFFPGEGRGGDVHLDEEEEWLLGNQYNKSGTSLFTVAVHEIGHSLGLFHSSDTNSLMYPWYQYLEPDFELPSDDQIAIQILYGPKNGNRLWGNNTPYKPNTRLPTSPNTTPMTRVSTTSKISASTTTTTTTTTTPASITTTPTTSSTRPPQRSSVEGNKPYFCNTSFDAVTVIRKETYFFKDKYIWRFGRDGLLPGYPALIEQMWSKLANVKAIDAVYERKDGKIVFFIGHYYYKFDGRDLLDGYPKPLTQLGLPEELDHVDAVTIWGQSNQTYIFAGNVYWKYDEKYDKIEELDYPRDMSVWKGVEYNIDAAFRSLDGATYFFKEREFWKFDDVRMSVRHQEPRSIGQYWYNCSAGTAGRRERLQTSAPAAASSAAAAYGPAVRLLPVLLTLAVVLFGCSLACDTPFDRPPSPDGRARGHPAAGPSSGAVYGSTTTTPRIRFGRDEVRVTPRRRTAV